MLTDKMLGVNGHNYVAVYDAILSRAPEAVLEIGIYQGGSLDYWHARGAKRVVGIDTLEPPPRISESYEVHLGDAYERTMLTEIDGWFDLVVDDGPHTIETQCFAAQHYAERVAPGGTFVVEDIWTMDDAAMVWDYLPRDMQPRSFIATTDGVGAMCPNPSIMLVSRRP